MSSPQTSDSVEIRIRELLIKAGSLESAVNTLFSEFKDPVPSREVLETIANFALRAGHLIELNQFLLEMLTKKAEIPWAHFCESIFHSSASVPISVREALISGAGAQRLLSELARSRALDSFDEGLAERAKKRKTLIQEKVGKIRGELLNVASLLKAQGLLKEEARILQRLIKFFPQDPELIRFKDEQLARQKKREVVDVVIEPRRQVRQTFYHYDSPSPEEVQILASIENSQRIALSNTKGPEEFTQLSQDFALTHVFLENYEAALGFLYSESLIPQESVRWLQYEIWLLQRNFGEILLQATHHLQEKRLTPEGLLALNYYKARALWGLHQDELAREIAETILSSHPLYRDLSVLLQDWKGESR